MRLGVTSSAGIIMDTQRVIITTNTNTIKRAGESKTLTAEQIKQSDSMWILSPFYNDPSWANILVLMEVVRNNQSLLIQAPFAVYRDDKAHLNSLIRPTHTKIVKIHIENQSDFTIFKINHFYWKEIIFLPAKWGSLILDLIRFSMSMIERSLVILKPKAVSGWHMWEIISRFERVWLKMIAGMLIHADGSYRWVVIILMID